MSLIEVTFVAGVIATTSAIAIPQLATSLDDIRARSAVRYLAGRLQKVRAEAVGRSANVAVRFTAAGGTYVFAVYADGNGNGVRNADIEAGIDPRLTPDQRLSDHFRGVAFGAWPELPAADPASTPPGMDPIRVGASDLLAFTPLGTATPGTLYLGNARHQYAVRVLGETGRTRILAFNPRTRTWSRL